MATYTSNYGLHQWAPEDNFLRTDFNEDLRKIDEAIKGVETDTDQKLTEKAEVVWGSYTGDGTENRQISLGFAPKGIILYCQETEMVMAYTGAPRMSHTGTVSMLSVTENGFQVHYGFYHSGLNDIDYRPVTNKSGEAYRYMVVK